MQKQHPKKIYPAPLLRTAAGKSGAGFTLVELLVVIAVIGLVASIIWVSLGGTTDKARIAKGESFDAQLYHVLGESLVGMWNLDNNAFDASGYGTTGTVYAGVSSAADRNNQAGKAYEFNGTNSAYIDMGTVPDGHLDFGTGDFTISFWMLRDSNVQNNLRVLSKGGCCDDVALNPAAAGYAFFGSNTNLQFGIGDGGPRTFVNAGGTIEVGKWQHVVGTRSGSSMRLYIDGILRGSTDSGLATSISNPSTNFYIGRSNAQYWDGKIDDVRIYNSVFSLAQVQELYAQGVDSHKNVEDEGDTL
ncbi:MAG: prepilin-type N-terminal cleavage/methylation domain-containing protein [Candidatus Wildermuthbacteria bacterium]|nr:prepilin-type N-terminal cleavage/methylation domain-containing protein [Candidatus Wildermuthbacteria bacterium]